MTITVEHLVAIVRLVLSDSLDGTDPDSGKLLIGTGLLRQEGDAHMVATLEEPVPGHGEGRTTAGRWGWRWGRNYGSRCSSYGWDDAAADHHAIGPRPAATIKHRRQRQFNWQLGHVDAPRDKTEHQDITALALGAREIRGVVRRRDLRRKEALL